jgi:hypothetical protein
MSNAASFMLWELAKHQEVQVRLRREIESVRATVGGAPLTADDLNRMPYLQAVVKVHRDRQLGHIGADRLLCRSTFVSTPLYPTLSADLERTMSCHSSSPSRCIPER